MSTAADTPAPAPAPAPPPLPKWPPGAELKTYTGGCHATCPVRFTFEFDHPAFGSPTMPVVSCNCSICAQRGYLFVYTPESKFRVTSGSLDALSSYAFHKKALAHKFCATCGCAPVAVAPTFGMVAVNVRAVDGVDVASLELHPVDGKAV